MTHMGYDPFKTEQPGPCHDGTGIPRVNALIHLLSDGKPVVRKSALPGIYLDVIRCAVLGMGNIFIDHLDLMQYFCRHILTTVKDRAPTPAYKHHPGHGKARGKHERTQGHREAFELIEHIKNKDANKRYGDTQRCQE